MEAVVLRIYARSNDLIKIMEKLQKQGLKVIVHSSLDRGEGYEEIIVYREIEV